MKNDATRTVAIEEEDYEAIIGYLVFVISWYGVNLNLPDYDEEIFKMLEKKYKPICEVWKRDKIKSLFLKGEH